MFVAERQRGLVRPTGKTAINWSHPRASKLAGAWVFGGLAGNTGLWIDELTGKFAPKITLTPGVPVEYNTVGAVGPCVAGVLGTSSTVAYATNCLSSGLNSGVSLVTVGMMPTAHTASYYPYVVGTSAGGGGDGIALGYGQYPSGQKVTFAAITSSVETASGMWLDGKKQASATVSDADLPFSRWFCTGHTCNPTVHGYPNVKLIRPPDNSAFIHIDCNLVSFIALFNTVLPDATMSALTLNPYDLLMFKEDEFFVPVLQAAAFKPAWARGSNLPVIGTGVF